MIRKFFSTLLAFIIYTGLLYPVLDAQERETTSLRPLVFKTDKDTISAQKLITPELRALFESVDKLGRSTPNDFYWVLLDFEGKQQMLGTEPSWVLYFGSFERSALFYRANGQLQKRDFGFFIPFNDYKQSMYDHSIAFAPEELIDSRYLLVRLQKLTTKRNMSSLRVSLRAMKLVKAEKPTIDLLRTKNKISAYVFTGIASVVLLFALSAYFIQKRKEYLFYSLYLFSLLVYFGRRAFNLHDLYFGAYPMLEYSIHMEFQVLINLFYVLFAKYFLATRENYPALDKAINWVTRALLIFIVIELSLIVSGQFSIHLVAMDIQRYFMATFGLIGSIYLLIKRKSALVYFIVIGSFSYTIGALATLLLFENDYMIFGSSIEIFIFTLGLGYKSRNVLMENARIQREVLQLEMKALRAQMNPHFIFNSLGSIQHLVRQDQKKEALQYLSRFSQLLRQILDSSTRGSVTIQEEIELLKNYVELESLRFEGRFTYSIEAEESLDIHNMEIPILLIQPHIENAILHGLLPKEGDAGLKVLFKDENDHVLCIVEDNGIGREEAARLKSTKGLAHKSRGVSIVADRVSRLQGQEADQELVRIDDINGPNGEVAGTRVSVIIPKEL